ncbi:MAG: hypothetical protein ABI583_03315 [Betaproteobacteria bacterium]
MNIASKALFVLLCSAGAAFATTQAGRAAKVERIANPELCYLDAATNGTDATLVRSELQRRNVACTSELRTTGQVSIERAASFQAASVSIQRARAAREMRDVRDTQRQVRCANQTQGGASSSAAGCTSY